MNYFTERVDEAAELFARAAERAGVPVEEHAHPERGPFGEPLKTLVARLGPAEPEHALAVVSGTHGIEGHAGSAIQTALLDVWGRNPGPSDLGLVFVHLINPWGCAWNRRENEDNVDVFRNLIYTDPPFIENALYDRYEAGINPRAWTGPDRDAADRILAQFVDAEGWDTVVATIRKGQHNHPKGITYHGAASSWSRDVVEHIGHRHLRGIRHLTVLDIHTGYGESGKPLIVPYDRPDSAKGDFIASHFGDIMLVPGNVPLIPAHPRAPYEIWQGPEGPQVLYIGLEFGTHDVENAFETFRANTYIHTYGSPLDDFGRATSSAYRELFYPADGRWRDEVLDQGLDIARKTVDVAAEAGRVLRPGERQ